MKITIKSIFLIICITSSLWSCKGQLNSNEHSASTNPETAHSTLQLDNQIWEIFQDSKGHYWFGSNGRGVYQYDGNELRLFTTDDGLVGNTIRGIQEDVNNNMVWIKIKMGIFGLAQLPLVSLDMTANLFYGLLTKNYLPSPMDESPRITLSADSVSPAKPFHKTP